MDSVGRRVAVVTAAAYVLGMALVVWSPVPLTEPLLPFFERMDLSAQSRLGSPPGLSLWALEFVANVALFVPPAFLLALRLRQSAWPLVVAAGFFCTLAIEAVQLLALPGRSATLSDVVANTLGAFAGAVAAFMLRSGTDRSPESLPQIRSGTR